MSSTSNYPEKTQLFLIRALTHLHPGSGDTGYGVVDKTVQRDPIDGLPVIHASSLKGAFREIFEQYYPPAHVGNKKIDHPLIEYIFGSGIGSTREEGNNTNDRISGSHRFHEARLLSIPVRSNVKPFFRATSPYIASELLQKNEQMDLGLKEKQIFALKYIANSKVIKHQPIIFSKDEQVWLEDFEAVQDIGSNFGNEFKELFGENLAIFHHDDLKVQCESLHVIARNYLENGVSRNLWYEEIIPRESRFYCLIQAPNHLFSIDYPSKYLEAYPQTMNTPSYPFPEVLEKTIKPAYQLQIGANASVGYGLCHVSLYSPVPIEQKS